MKTRGPFVHLMLHLHTCLLQRGGSNGAWRERGREHALFYLETRAQMAQIPKKELFFILFYFFFAPGPPILNSAPENKTRPHASENSRERERNNKAKLFHGSAKDTKFIRQSDSTGCAGWRNRAAHLKSWGCEPHRVKNPNAVGPSAELKWPIG